MKTIVLSMITSLVLYGGMIHPTVERRYLHHQQTREDTLYKVVKIDSLHDFYLIYARNWHDLYKIVSQKSTNHCRDIEVNATYAFQLHSYLLYNGRPIFPGGFSLELSGWMVDRTTFIKFEGDSIRDLYFADNITGLCFTPKK